MYEKINSHDYYYQIVTHEICDVVFCNIGMFSQKTSINIKKLGASIELGAKNHVR
jgi:hypothetical protein